ncbi:hypothetical protein PENTCL1PPCAC_5010, partial [Pristionchus entomophagus]
AAAASSFPGITILLQPRQPLSQFQRLPVNDFSLSSAQRHQSLPSGHPATITRKAARPSRSYPFSTLYRYPERRKMPLPSCFHNPSGYVCCNLELNNLMEDTIMELQSNPKFNPCNINLMASKLQLATQAAFNTSFETVVGHEDFAQKITFRGDLACKIEMGGKSMVAYATDSDAYNHDLSKPSRRSKRAHDEFDFGVGHMDSWHSVHSYFL